MRRAVFWTLIFLFFLCSGAAAQTIDYDVILGSLIEQNGSFDGENGIIYASKAQFNGETFLLTVGVKGNVIECAAYDDADGIECTDILDIPFGSKGTYTVSVVNDGENNFLMAGVNSTYGFYTIENDFFTRISDINFEKKTDIAVCTGGSVKAISSKRDLYNFFNGLKRDKINAYSMPNYINTLSAEERQRIFETAAACADIMEYNANSSNYDDLMRYLLPSNRNFRALTDMQNEYLPESGGLSIVNAEYIDDILLNVFETEPEHPSVNSLLKRGFCFDNGYYYYKNPFNVFFATDVLDIDAVYNLSDELKYVIFTDIYRQGESAFPEYSYMILKKKDIGYAVKRIGMGKNLLSERELLKYTPHTANSFEKTQKAPEHTGTLLMALVSAAAVISVCGIIFSVHQYTRK